MSTPPLRPDSFLDFRQGQVSSTEADGSRLNLSRFEGTMRAKATLTLLLVSFLIQVGFIAEQRRVRQLEPNVLTPGAVVESVPLSVHRSGRETVAGTANLSEVIGDRCTILIFFQSDCLYCRQVAEVWQGTHEVEFGKVTIPVKWVAVDRNDPGATRLVSQFDLTSPWYSIRGREDRMALGVAAWPKLLLFAPQGLFLEELARDIPSGSTALPTRCMVR